MTADFDGDGRPELAVFRPSNGTWYVKGRSSVHFGTSGDVPRAYDYNADGRAELVIWRPWTGRWYVHGDPYGLHGYQYGLATDIPVMGRYGGDPGYFPAVFRPSNGTWYGAADGSTQFGSSGDIPVPENYGTCHLASCSPTGAFGSVSEAWDLAVFRPATGTWYVWGIKTVRYGASGDIPVPARYTGGRGDPMYGPVDTAVFRPSTGTWYVPGRASVRYGTSGDIPVPADYDGNGHANVAVFRPSNGTWYINR